jgi:HNH endonuclease
MAVRFDPVGTCIYCGKKNTRLNEEHIIPFGLGGQFILPEASCRACETITAKFEGVVQRTIYGDFRMRHNLPSRRKKDRPKFRTIGTLGPDGQVSKKDVPVEEFPAPYWVYTFGQCGILLGSQPDTDVSLWTMKTIHDTQAMDAFIEKYNWDRTLNFKVMPYHFMRMIAKIAHSFAVALIGYNCFKPIILGPILNEKANVSYFVGMNEKQEPFGLTHGHEVKIVFQGRISGTTLIIVHVRLFPFAETPTYHAVVGEFVDIQQESLAIEKLEKTKDVQLARSVGQHVPAFLITGV